MGIYLNPGNQGFWEAVCSRIYVDKTGLIAYTNECINTKEKYICVSRPRRFGKSMALEMLAAYYSRNCDSKELFRGRKIENAPTFQQHLNRYDVIYLNMQQFLTRARNQDVIEYLEQTVIAEIRDEYGTFFPEHETILAVVLERIYAKTGKQFIFLIDEWDCIMRERQESEDLQRQYLDFLRGLLKDEPYVALAYMTGILPVKKYGSHSALNMFWEYSMTDQFALEEYTGFTEEEVRELCRQYDMDFYEISNWYDGYSFRHFKHIYNPRSVVAAMANHAVSNYWTSTETYEALKIYIDMDFEGLKRDIVCMLGGERVKVNAFSFRNDMRNLRTKDDVLALLIHLGYLGYDSEEREAFIPNKEICAEFENAMSVGGWAEVMRVLKASAKLLEDTLLGDEKAVAEGLDRAHMEVASILTYNDENSLGCAIGLAYYSARKDYRIIREMPTGRGFADLVFLPLPSSGKPALVVELKYDKNAYSAIQQIKDRKLGGRQMRSIYGMPSDDLAGVAKRRVPLPYTQALEGYAGEILLVGINYDKEKKDKPHSCVIERVEK